MDSIQSSHAWQTVAQMLTCAQSGHGLERISPADGLRLSLLQAMGDQRVAAGVEQRASGQRLQGELQAVIHQLTVFDKISRCPILGIAGLLNSGKSSLLATYLSCEGRRRVLRGVSNKAGTHRFVLWLPTRWREQAELISTLHTFVAQLFGHAAEQLADEPDLAARQYNGQILTGNQRADGVAQVDPLSVPLVAYDEALDDLQVGLLDCPDIQTGLGVGSQAGDCVASARQQRLAAIGRLCSAFIVVSRMNSLHDQALLDLLTTLRDAMPGVPRFLAINRVKARYEPDVVAGQARGLIDRFGISKLFVAYDFRSLLASTRIPPQPSGMVPELDGSPQPIFFEPQAASGNSTDVSSTGKQAAGSADRTSSATVDQPKYLFHLGQQLDPGSLSAECCRSLVLQLRGRALEAVDWIQNNEQLRRQQIVDVWQSIAQACYEFMAQRNAEGKCIGLRLQTSPAIIAQMTDSLRRTAPMWLRPSMYIDRTARQLQQAVAAKAERLKIMHGASKMVTDFAKRFRRGEGAQVMTPERIGRAIRSFDVHDALQALPDDQLQIGCQRALERFAVEDQPELDASALDEWSRSVWSNMSWSDQLRRGAQPLALVVGPLLAALLIPVDGGGTSVLVFASIQELMAAAGVTAVLAAAAGGGQAMKIVQEETPWRQLSDLFAILCDSLGLPRPSADELPSCGSNQRQLLASEKPMSSAGAWSALSLWRATTGALADLQSAAEKLS
ncbi:MAG: hypothetical protein KF752_03420 [Pirellulaceae bacterium]|nr:hypothetical protein [Pirellulaceae bacterium]